MISPIQGKTELIVLMHYREWQTTTNTGRLAHLSYLPSQVVLRGLREDLNPGAEAALQSMLQASPGQTAVLYPAKDSVELTPEWLNQNWDPKKPMRLVVPDGSWRQAQKVRAREPSLRERVAFRLPGVPVTGYGALRQAPRLGATSTIEAIAGALQILETWNQGANSVGPVMNQVFNTFKDRVLWSRGQKKEIL